MTPNAATLGIFAKWPEPGRAKTRMIPLLGEQGAAALARQLLVKSLQWVDACPDGIHPVLWVDGGSQAQWTELLVSLKLTRHWQVLPQSQGHLGQRMQHAMQVQFEQSPCSLIMGTDTPTLSPVHVDALLGELAQHDAAFIPALDGGYVMVGMARLCASAFGALDWGSERVAEQTKNVLNQSGCTHAWLPPEPDLDVAQDYEQALAAGWVSPP
jgi:rSAM/selenodomain-associated transferase 1